MISLPNAPMLKGKPCGRDILLKEQQSASTMSVGASQKASAAQ
jgi:hypothetical protein